jgi:alpha-L-rhamnosidase
LLAARLNALPLVFGMAPTSDPDALVNNLVADIRNHNTGLTADDIGYRYLLRALADSGRSDVIYEMNKGRDRPGYGYMLAKGATSLTEGWNGSASQDHFMLGHIMEWFYSDLAGIQCDSSAIAFKKISIKPTPVGDVTSARAEYTCVYGKIESSWKTTSDRLVLDVRIPANTMSTIYILANYFCFNYRKWN